MQIQEIKPEDLNAEKFINQNSENFKPSKILSLSSTDRLNEFFIPIHREIPARSANL